jgi:hypothetical protein
MEGEDEKVARDAREAIDLLLQLGNRLGTVDVPDDEWFPKEKNREQTPECPGARDENPMHHSKLIKSEDDDSDNPQPNPVPY